MATYAELREEAQAQGAKVFFLDEAHFRADVELRAKWVLRGEPALVDMTSPRLGEKATYYSAVCLETGQLEAMPDFNSDEAIWDWIREAVTAYTCFGKAAKVREHIDALCAGLAQRADEVKQRCRRELQAQADALVVKPSPVTAYSTRSFSPCD